MKIVLDTNIYYSAIGFDNLVYDVLVKIFNKNEYQVYCSYSIFQELETKLYSEKFNKKTNNRLSKLQKQEFLDLVKANVIFVEPKIKVKLCRDQSDDKFLELAAAIEADYIISGDKDLTDLQLFQKSRILKPSQFLGR